MRSLVLYTHVHTDTHQVFNSGGKVSTEEAWKKAGKPGSSKTAATQSIRRYARLLREEAAKPPEAKGSRPHTYNTQPTSLIPTLS